MCARLEIQTGRLASRRARAVRAKCSLAGLTTNSAKRPEGRAARAAGLVVVRSSFALRTLDGRCAFRLSSKMRLKMRERIERAG